LYLSDGFLVFFYDLGDALNLRDLFVHSHFLIIRFFVFFFLEILAAPRVFA
jgi:hypothetical protein